MAEGLEKMKEGKATETDGMTVEFVECVDEALTEWMMKLFRKFLKSGIIQL